ncbi:DUF2029 domain-containing protein [bacterium]|nr:DUF2029 domain-containing protein [bacterium]
MKPVLRVVLAGLLMEACFVGMVALGDLRRRVPGFLLLHLAAFLVYLAVALPLSKGAPRSGARGMAWIVAFGLLFRVTLWCSPAVLSDDLYRYLWDGRVQAHGVNPYRYPPGAPELTALRDDLHPRINHPEIPTIYPPLAQAVFLLIALISPTPLAVKVTFTLFDLGTAWLLYRLLVRRGGPPEALIVYLWSPLVVVEVAGSGHVDALAIFCLIAALLRAEEEKPVRASVALSLSILSKFFAAALIPAFCTMKKFTAENAENAERIRMDETEKRRNEETKKRLFADTPTPRFPVSSSLRPLRSLRYALWGRAVLLIPLILLAAYLPYAGAGANLFIGLRTYAEHWQFNDLLFRYIAAWAGPGRARHGVLLLFGLTALVLAVRKVDLLTSAYLLVGAFLLLTPTLHPWYALWIVPFLTLRRSAAWLLLTGLVPLSYHVLIRYVSEGVWVEAEWVRWAEFGPFVAVWVGEYIWRRMKGERQKI